MAINRKVLLKNKSYSAERIITGFESKCPQCHVSIHLDSDDILGHNIIWEKSFELFFQCPRCNKSFISSYYSSEGVSYGVFAFRGSEPIKPIETDIVKELIELSAQFSQIFK